MTTNRAQTSSGKAAPSNKAKQTQNPPSQVTFDINKFNKECLDEHNRLRKLHGCDELTLNAKLCEYATKWAQHLCSVKKLEHRTEHKYGENLFMSQGMEANGRIPVTNWYNEIKDYNFSKPGFSPQVGHFTQVIWRDSKQVGVGICQKGNAIWVVANYDPPGNFVNAFEQNVPRLKD